LANVTVSDVGPCKKQLKISVPAADVQTKLEETYKRLQTSAVVNGFRKGHVPRKLIERRFGEEVVEEVKQDILAESTQKALDDEGLKPLGEPSFDNVEFDTGKDCIFEVTVEIEPTFDLPEYKGIALKKSAVTVTDKDTERGLEGLRRQRARLALMGEDATVETGDRLVCDWTLTSEGEDVASEKDDMIVAGGKRFGETELEEDTAKVLGGAKFGEKRAVAVTFLDTYPIEKWRGKPGELTVTAKEIRRPVLPELNEEFVKAMDFESLDEMKEFVRRSIAQSKEREAAMALEQSLFDRLLEGCPFDLPDGVRKSQASNIMTRQQFRLRQRGMPQEEIDAHLEDLRSASEEAAARNLKIFFILNKIAEKEKIFVTENEVENRIASLANSYRIGTQKMRSRLEADGALSELRAGMREDKVVEFLLKNAKIEEAS